MMTGIYNPDKYPQQTGWRAYQDYLQRHRRRGQRRVALKLNRRRLTALAAGIVLTLAVVWGLSAVIGNERPAVRRTAAPTVAPAVASAPRAESAAADMVKKTDVHILLGKNHLRNIEQQPLQVTFDGRAYEVCTSLDLGLQQYLLKKMDRVNSRYIGIVAMAPDTGRVLTMASFNKRDPESDPCLTADYPAASLFKIVTAAAAVEEKGYTATSRFKFNGYKHTLYKRQLTDKTNRYTNALSLRDSFAQSVNPVFGKIGALYLDRQSLLAYGGAFGFNRRLPFEVPWPASHLTIDEGSYHLAEIASGFNRRTTLSPLHAAVIVSAVVNDGVPVEPTVVDRIVDEGGKAVYRSEPRFLPVAVSPKTARVLDQLMNATITSGTARKIFRGYRRNKVLSRLHLGGKTGSIYNRAHDARFDWFVGYASEKKGAEKMVIAVVVAHEEYIGTRAGQYARMAIEHYFRDYFAKQETAGENSSG